MARARRDEMRFATVAEPENQLSEDLEWRQLARRQLAEVWKGEADSLYDYLNLSP